MEIKGAIILGGFINALAVARAFVGHGLEAILVNDKPFQPANFTRCSTYIKSPAIHETKQFLQFLENLPVNYQKQNYWLIPTCDIGVKILSENKQILEKDYLVLADNQSVIDLIQDKAKIFALLRAYKINIPRFTVVKKDLTTLKDFKYPVIIKSRLPHRHDLKKIKIVAKNYEEAKNQLETLPPALIKEGVMVQEYLKGLEQVSFSGFIKDGEIIRFFMSQKVRSRPAEYGSFTVIETIFNEKLYYEARKIMRKLKFTGICEIEFLFDRKKGHFIFIEINPRFWMQNSLAQKIGVDLVEPLLNSDAKKQKTKNSYKIGIKWVHFYSDLAQAVTDARNKRFSWEKYWAGLKGEKIEAVFSLLDPIPFYIETIQGVGAFLKGKF